MNKTLRAKLRIALAFMAYWTGVCSLFYWLNRNAKRIITFHNVLPVEIYSAIKQIGCTVSFDYFQKVISEIRKRFAFSCDIEDPKTVTVTFDDGFLNQYEIAGRWLMRNNIPAILFVAGDVIGVSPSNTLTTEKILLWNDYAPDSAVHSVFGNTVSRNTLWREYVQPAYRSDGRSRGLSLLSRLEEAYPISGILSSLPEEWRRLRLSGVSEAQLAELRSQGWAIGWHTQSHYPLAFLNDNDLRKELDSPKEYKSVVLSFPYGEMGAIGEKSIKVARELGYPCALFDNDEYLASRNLFSLPRVGHSANRYELHFILSGLKYFIKNGRLLPKIQDLMNT